MTASGSSLEFIARTLGKSRNIRESPKLVTSDKIRTRRQTRLVPFCPRNCFAHSIHP